MKQDPVLDALTQASKGLLFPSETDAELEPFAWPDGAALTPERVLQLSGSKARTAIEQTTLPDLFVTVPQADRAKFDALRKLLESQLGGIAVYKIGAEPEKAVYIVGKTKDGRWAGLKTTVVET